MIDERTIRQLAASVERQGGDLDEAQAIVGVWRKLHTRLAAANDLSAQDDEATADRVWAQLEAEFAKPLDDVVREHLNGRR